MSHWNWVDLVENGYLDSLRELVEEAGQEILDRKFDDDPTALHLAVRHGHIDIVEFLLTECTDVVHVDTYDDEGRASIHTAREQDNLEMVQVLVRYGCDVNATVYDNDDKTPLLLAIEEGYWEIAQFLVEQGRADVNAAESSTGTTALQHVIQSDCINDATLRLQMVQLLVGAQADVMTRMTVARRPCIMPVNKPTLMTMTMTIVPIWKLSNV
jgi:uncharacterized protein